MVTSRPLIRQPVLPYMQIILYIGVFCHSGATENRLISGIHIDCAWISSAVGRYLDSYLASLKRYINAKISRGRQIITDFRFNIKYKEWVIYFYDFATCSLIWVQIKNSARGPLFFDEKNVNDIFTSSQLYSYKSWKLSVGLLIILIHIQMQIWQWFSSILYFLC